jgi:hypothetical protein
MGSAAGQNQGTACACVTMLPIPRPGTILMDPISSFGWRGIEILGGSSSFWVAQRFSAAIQAPSRGL